jgi:hypothetical protein
MAAKAEGNPTESIGFSATMLRDARVILRSGFRG